MILLKFSASWCNPCRQLSRTLQTLPEDQLPVSIQDIDIDKETGMSVMWRIRSVPTLVLLDETGEEIKRISGALNKDELIKFLGDTL